MKSAKNKTAGNVQLDEPPPAPYYFPDRIHIPECNPDEFPVVRTKCSANWAEIVKEGEEKMRQITEYMNSKKEKCPDVAFLDTECDFIRDSVFTTLLPVLEQTLEKAKIWNATTNPKCFFNGLDYIAQEVWNNNPLHPERRENRLHIFNMPWARSILHTKPRKVYPKSWLWTEEHAATVLQSHWRQYLVQRDEEVEEMRDFWKKLKLERANPDIASNPLLAKMFASSRSLYDPMHDEEDETNAKDT